jgi:Arf-GAP domain and FG repeat-containing protein 1
MQKKAENPMDVLRLLPENKQCFDCQEKGTTYVLMSPWGVFVCSTCAGVHRDFSHKAKGIAMSNFNADEIAFLTLNGNKVCFFILFFT